MYYFYFSYAFIIAIVIFVLSLKQNESKWWGALVFFSPITAPFYFLKTKAKKGIIPALITALIFIGVCAGEYHVHIKRVKKINYSQYPPVVRQAIRLSSSLKIITNNLNDDIAQLNQLSRSESSLENMSATIELIGKMRVKIIKRQAAFRRLSSFLNDYESNLEQNGFERLINIKKYYNNTIATLYFKKLKIYLDTFESLLQFTFENFNKISRKVPVALDNYDAYYLRYRGAMDDYNRIGNRKIEFQNRFLKENPELVKFLPQVLHLNSLELKSKLKLWK